MTGEELRMRGGRRDGSGEREYVCSLYHPFGPTAKSRGEERDGKKIGCYLSRLGRSERVNTRSALPSDSELRPTDMLPRNGDGGRGRGREKGATDSDNNARVISADRSRFSAGAEAERDQEW